MSGCKDASTKKPRHKAGALKPSSSLMMPHSSDGDLLAAPDVRVTSRTSAGLTGHGRYSLSGNKTGVSGAGAFCCRRIPTKDNPSPSRHIPGHHPVPSRLRAPVAGMGAFAARAGMAGQNSQHRGQGGIEGRLSVSLKAPGL